jgi:hypothetical protein
MASPGVTIDGERVQPTTMHAPKADGSRHREFFTTYSKRVLSAGQTTVSALAVVPLKPGDNAAQLAGCITLESRTDQEVRVTITPPAVNSPVVVKISGDAVAVERADAARTAEAKPGRK